MSHKSNINIAIFGLSAAIFSFISRMKNLRPRTNSKSSERNLQDSACTVSTPGKALIAGGYLVLEYPHVGITIAASSCFHTTMKILMDNDSNRTDSVDSLDIIVESPQFFSQYEFSYNIQTKILSLKSSYGNIFIEKCLLLAFIHTREYYGLTDFNKIIMSIASRGKLGLKLRADNDFYSQIQELKRRNLPLLSSSLKSLPKFMPCPRDDKGVLQVSKTGMGSSAALATSLVGALLHFLGVVHLRPYGDATSTSADINIENTSIEERFQEDLFIVHNVSQLAHAIAQGKIGSGFDVAAAVYGSQLYRRFDPSGAKIQQCMNISTSTMNNVEVGVVLQEAVQSRPLWAQMEVCPFSLPYGLGLVMGDICGGSSSTSMAKEVLRWRKEKVREADLIWKELGDTNEFIAGAFFTLSSLAERDIQGYTIALERAASVSADNWDSLSLRLLNNDKQNNNNDNSDISSADTYELQLKVIESLSMIRALFIKARSLLKRMGIGAGVDIEPDSQTKLADATQSLPGVLCAGVPGAGGVDAIFAITICDTGRLEVEKMWSDWEGGDVVCPLLLNEQRRSYNGHAGIALNPDIGWD